MYKYTELPMVRQEKRKSNPYMESEVLIKKKEVTIDQRQVIRVELEALASMLQIIIAIRDNYSTENPKGG